jgi:hypothetical protein
MELLGMIEERQCGIVALMNGNVSTEKHVVTEKPDLSQVLANINHHEYTRG